MNSRFLIKETRIIENLPETREISIYDDHIVINKFRGDETLILDILDSNENMSWEREDSTMGFRCQNRNEHPDLFFEAEVYVFNTPARIILVQNPLDNIYKVYTYSVDWNEAIVNNRNLRTILNR